MEVSEFEIVNSFNLIQPEKADSPIEVTELGITSFVKYLH